MKLYHFTPRHRLEPVLRHGLTRGLTPVIDGDTILRIPGYQWLTRNPSFRQSWNDASLLPFDRTAYRIEIAVPRSAGGHLLPWLRWKAELGGRMMPGFDAHGDPENWLLFRGTVPPAWFRRITANPRAAEGGGGRKDFETLETKKNRLLHLCEWFIREHDLQSREIIHDTDRVTQDAARLVENMCGIVGYAAPSPFGVRNTTARTTATPSIEAGHGRRQAAG